MRMNTGHIRDRTASVEVGVLVEMHPRIYPEACGIVSEGINNWNNGCDEKGVFIRWIWTWIRGVDFGRVEDRCSEG